MKGEAVELCWLYSGFLKAQCHNHCVPYLVQVVKLLCLELFYAHKLAADAPSIKLAPLQLVCRLGGCFRSLKVHKHMARARVAHLRHMQLHDLAKLGALGADVFRQLLDLLCIRKLVRGGGRSGVTTRSVKQQQQAAAAAVEALTPLLPCQVLSCC